MICDFPEHGKVQPNHPNPVGPPLEYMRDHQVFEGIHSDIYDLCRFYTLGMMGDPPEFPTPQEPMTHGQIRDLLKSACAIGQPYLILEHSADSVMAPHHHVPVVVASQFAGQVSQAVLLPLLRLCWGK